MNRLISFLLLCACCFILLPGSAMALSVVGGAFTNPAEHVELLLEQGDVDTAAAVIVKEEAYFKGAYGDQEVKALLDRFTLALEEHHAPNIGTIHEDIERISWPQPLAKWQRVREQLDKLQAALDDALSPAIFKYEMYRPVQHRDAVAALKNKRREIQKDAVSQFGRYAFESNDNFFTAYPVEVDRKKVLIKSEAAWGSLLSAGNDEQSAFFMAKYGAFLPQEAKEAYAERYFLTLCPNPKTAPLKDILEAYEKCKLSGLPLKTIPQIKIGFLQVTSPTLIKDKAIDFAVNVKLDLPFDADKASMRKMFSHDAVKEADILILMNVAMSKARRVVERRTKIKSMFAESFVREDNPEYDIVKAELQSASTQFHMAQSRGEASWPIATIGKVFGSSKEEKVEDAGKRLTVLQEKLRTTSQTISVPNFQPYNVIQAHMDIYKAATVNYYIVDKRSKTLFQDTIDVRDKSFFTVCYDLHETDQNREKYLQTSVLEEDVVRHELQPVVVNLSDMLAQYMGSPQAKSRYTSMAAVNQAIVRDRSHAQRQARSERFGYEKGYDKRFDSVVVVRNVGTGLGTGFYVTENLILTNYHVVEENEYVRLRLYDEREMMGRVIARDMHLDLALIQADIRQKPVCFYNKRTLPHGVTLEAIGHPVSLRFTITRGILSTIRKRSPILYTGKSQDAVLFIQTDAAINGGNSGGPLFYGDYVVGVNDWGIDYYGKKKRPADGLGFAIHYSEVFKFLERHGVDVCKGSK